MSANSYIPISREEYCEFKYLDYFYSECDFGPAHEDVVELINDSFETEFKRPVPVGYRLSEEESE